MRLGLSVISERTPVIIRGDEPWLERIYKDFPLAEVAGGRPLLTAKLELTAEESGAVLVVGEVSYAPRVNCSRCALVMNWPMHIDVRVRFLPEQANETPKEKTLSRDELDVYFLDDHSVDIEQLIIDTIETATPTRFLPLAEDGHSCRVCKVDTRTEQVYGAGVEADESSPFSVLKGLKLPQ